MIFSAESDHWTSEKYYFISSSPKNTSLLSIISSRNFFSESSYIILTPEWCIQISNAHKHHLTKTMGLTRPKNQNKTMRILEWIQHQKQFANSKCSPLLWFFDLLRCVTQFREVNDCFFVGWSLQKRPDQQPSYRAIALHLTLFLVYLFGHTGPVCLLHCTRVELHFGEGGWLIIFSPSAESELDTTWVSSFSFNANPINTLDANSPRMRARFFTHTMPSAR